MPLTNDEAVRSLKTEIKGLGDLMAAELRGVRQEIHALSDRVGVQNGRVGKVEGKVEVLEKAKVGTDEVAKALRARDAADDERQTIRLTRFQVWIGVGGVLVGALAGLGGLLTIVHHI